MLRMLISTRHADDSKAGGWTDWKVLSQGLAPRLGDWNIWEPAQLEAFWHLSTVCSVFAYSLQRGSFRVTRLAYFSPVLQGQESEPGGKCTTFSDLALDVTLHYFHSLEAKH